MASKKNNRRRRRGLFVAEIIILVVLSVALFAAVWVTHKLSLVNYDTDFDRSQVKTSTEYNQSGNRRMMPRLPIRRHQTRRLQTLP